MLKNAWTAAVLTLGLAVATVVIWQAVVERGVPNPTAPHLGEESVIVNSALLVFR